ncbi:hypothetical protein M6D93_01965 [Jatrophihabitans telluris]|uniref:Ammonia permease n=1 Tax=Jatrophihabitans telluris TaxID=2038343 RepID=A0ABY4QZ34_9ACTN|nr:hypothetical protein [Jatrophihabitans telluris]UQX88778.1 hypothetical protein M6D93_01965 [Jatrophihabitans telluris]
MTDPVSDAGVLDPVPLASTSTGRLAQIPLAVVTLLAGGLLMGGSYLGTVGLLVAVAVVQAALVASWVLGAGLPGRIGAVLLGVAASAATDAAVVHWNSSGYEPVLGVLGVALPAMFVHQLARGVVRTRVVESLSDITVLLLAVCAIGGLLLLRYQANGDKTVLAVVGATTAALVVCHLGDAVLPAPRFDPQVDRGLPAVVLGVIAGGAVGALVLGDIIDFQGGRALFAGAAIGAVACLLSVGASFAWVHSTLVPAPAAIPATEANAVATPTPPAAGSASAQGPAAGAATGPVEADADSDDDDGPDDELGRLDVRAWTGVPRLRPVAAALITVALTAPAGYVLMNALVS